MPRFPRIDVPGLVYHLTNRGTNKQPIFLSDRDRQDFMRLILITKDEFPFILHSYSLMTNHFHLLLETINDSLSKTMQYLTGCYGQLFNRRHGRSGRMVQGRFHSIPVQEDSYFTVAARYIALNAPRAGIIMRPEEYRWCDYRSIVTGEPDPIADSSFLLGYFGKEVAQQRALYKQFVESELTKTNYPSQKILYKMKAWGDLGRILVPHQNR